MPISVSKIAASYMDETPRKNLATSPDDETDKTPVKEEGQESEKRKIKVFDSLKSRYVNRVVEINKYLKVTTLLLGDVK